MELQILGAHNCETRDARLTSLLIDGRLAIDAGGLTSSLSYAEQLSIRAILITHHHFDHIRDLATLGMNVFASGPVNVYATAGVLETISSYLFDGVLYVEFHRKPSPDKPAFRLCPIEPYKETAIEGYKVLPLPVSHVIPTVGYQVTSPDGKTLFYTGDTGGGLAKVWEATSPDLLLIEVTVPEQYRKAAEEHGHLSPQTLKQELLSFKKIKGYLPPVITVHMRPHIEGDIRKEVAQVAAELGADITVGYEGMQVVL